MKKLSVFLICIFALLASQSSFAQKEIEIENDKIKFLDDGLKRFAWKLQFEDQLYLNGDDEEGIFKIDKYGNMAMRDQDLSDRFGLILVDPFDGTNTYSAAGINPAAILKLKEKTPLNFARIHFENGMDPYWQVQARSTNNPILGLGDPDAIDPEMRFYYHDVESGSDHNIMSLDGDDETVSINRTADACAHLHVKEKRDDFAAIAMQNNGHGNDIWSWEIKKDNLFLYYDELGTCENRIKFLEYDVRTNGTYETSPGCGADGGTRSALKPSWDEPVMQKVMQLNPSQYYHDHDNVRDRKTIGFYAEEVEAVFPNLVRTDQDDPTLKSLNYRDFTVLAIKAIQEQQVMINQLQNQVQTLLDASSSKIGAAKTSEIILKKSNQ